MPLQTQLPLRSAEPSLKKRYGQIPDKLASGREIIILDFYVFGLKYLEEITVILIYQ